MSGTYIDIAMGSGVYADWFTATRCIQPSWLLSLPSWIWPFLVPDYCAPSWSLWQWVTLLFAHFGFGAFLGLLPLRIALGVLTLWFAKEGLADLPIAGWSWQAVLDSTIDLGAGILGLMAITRPINKGRRHD